MAAIAPLRRASRFMLCPFTSTLALHGTPVVVVASSLGVEGTWVRSEWDSFGQSCPNQGNPSSLRRCHPCRPIWPCEVSALGTWQQMSNRGAKAQSHGQACRPAIGVRSTFERRFGGQCQKLFARCLSALPQKPHRTDPEAFQAPNGHGGGFHMHPTPKRP